MKNKKFTKDDLKVGYVVKQRDGVMAMVMPNANGVLVYVEKNGKYMSSASYTDDLLHKSVYPVTINVPDLDIVEVYGFSRQNNKTLDVSTTGRDLLWKREPEKTCDDCAHKVVCTHVGMCEHFMAKAE